MAVMVQNVRQIKVNTEDSEYLEALNYDVSAHRALLDFMVAGNTAVESDGFTHYHNKYKDVYVEFELAKKEIERKYLGDWAGRCNWNLDFATQEITATMVK